MSTGVLAELGVGLQYSTNFTPPTPVGGGGSGSLGAFLQPQVTLVDAGGNVIAATAPYGAPNSPENWVPAMLVGVLLLLAIGLGGYGVGKALGG